MVEVNSQGQVVSEPVPYTNTLPDVSSFTDMSITAMVIWGILAAFVIIFFLKMIVIVEQQSIRVIERFGKFVRIMRPGLNFKIPFIERAAGKMDMRTQQLVVSAETKTKDNVFVAVKVAVQYFVLPEKVYDAFYKLEDPSKQITAYVLDTIRAQIPTLTLDAVFEKKESIATAVKLELTQGMDDFGYSIVTALLVDIDPNENVKASMNEINAQTRLREAAAQKAEGEKVIKVKNAEAEAEAKALQGKGVAEQRKHIIEGLKETAAGMAGELGISATEVMSLILMTQYFDTIRESGANKVILMPHQPSGMLDIKSQIMASLESKQ